MATNSVYTAPKSTTTACNCPACRGLECLERPRFFAGQLLTEAELNSEQAYLLAKNRLHNKYLHGSGVVCGLEVVCHQCDGFVRVKSGYAIDPCGNDVIVCKDVDFNVIDAIQKCVDARKRSTNDDCPPWRDTQDTCVADEVHWCIALEYIENETRGVMPLQNTPAKNGGCGCGGSASSTSSSSGCGCQTKSAPTPARPAACEATRVLEQYRLTVVPEPASCTEARTLTEILGRLSGTIADFPPPGSFIAALLPAGLQSNKLLQTLVAAAPSASLLSRVLAISDKIEAFFATRFTAPEKRTLIKNIASCLAAPAKTTATGSTSGTGDWMYLNLGDINARFPAGTIPDPPLTVDLCCRFRRAVSDLYTQNPFNVRCEPFNCIPCQDKQTTGTTTTTTTTTTSGQVPTTDVARSGTGTLPGGGTTTTNNDNTQLIESFCCVARAFVDYIVDAVCSAIIPPCPPDPPEDRLIIACVTIKDNRIVDICNHSCRRYAGSFPALQYWTSAVPIVPLIQRLLRELCCASSAVPVIAQISAALQAWKGGSVILPRDPIPVPVPPPETQPTVPGQPGNPIPPTIPIA